MEVLDKKELDVEERVRWEVDEWVRWEVEERTRWEEEVVPDLDQGEMIGLGSCEQNN